jgi:hypothetical protein
MKELKPSHVYFIILLFLIIQADLIVNCKRIIIQLTEDTSIQNTTVRIRNISIKQIFEATTKQSKKGKSDKKQTG